jgi:hypothetical protein
MNKVKTTSFTKVVGYLAPVENFNIGQKAQADVRVKVAV